MGKVSNSVIRRSRVTNNRGQTTYYTTITPIGGGSSQSSGNANPNLVTSGGRPVYLPGESQPLTKQRVERERQNLLNQRAAQQVRNLGVQKVLSLSRKVGIPARLLDDQIILMTSPNTAIVAKVENGKVYSIQEKSKRQNILGTSKIDTRRLAEFENRLKLAKQAKSSGMTVKEFRKRQAREIAKQGAFKSLPTSVQERRLKENQLIISGQIPRKGSSLKKLKDLSAKEKRELLKINLSYNDTYNLSLRKKKATIISRVLNQLKQIPLTLKKGLDNKLKAADLTLPQVKKTLRFFNDLNSLKRELKTISKKDKVTASEKQKADKLLQNLKASKVEAIKAFRDYKTNANKEEIKKLLNSEESKAVNQFALITAVGLGASVIGGVTGLILSTSLEGYFAYQTGGAIARAIRNPTVENITDAAVYAIPTALGLWGLIRGARRFKLSNKNLDTMRSSFNERIRTNNKLIARLKKAGNTKGVKTLLAENRYLKQALKEVRWTKQNLFKGKKINPKTARTAYKRLQESYKSGLYTKAEPKVRLKLNPKIAARLAKAGERISRVTGKIKAVSKSIRDNATRPFIKAYARSSEITRNTIRRINSTLKFEYKWTISKTRSNIRDFSIKARSQINRLLTKINNSKTFSALKRNVTLLKNILKRQGINLQVKLSSLKQSLSRRTLPLRNKVELYRFKARSNIRKLNNAIGERLLKFNTKKAQVKLSFQIAKYNTNIRLKTLGRNAILPIRRLINKIKVAYIKGAKPRITFLKNKLKSYGISIQIVARDIKGKIGRGAVKIKESVTIPAKRIIYNNRMKINKIRKTISNAISPYARKIRIALKDRSVKRQIARYNTNERIKVLARKVKAATISKIARKIKDITRSIRRAGGRITEPIRIKIRQLNRISPIQIEIIRPEYGKINVRPAALRTLSRSARKRLLKSLKARAKAEPSIVKQLKIKSRPARLALQKERLLLRRQMKLENKIAKGLQVKSIRELPSKTSKGYPIVNERTGEIRYIQSAKKYIKYLKRQYSPINTVAKLERQDLVKLLNSAGKKEKFIQKRILEYNKNIQGVFYPETAIYKYGMFKKLRVKAGDIMLKKGLPKYIKKGVALHEMGHKIDFKYDLVKKLPRNELENIFQFVTSKTYKNPHPSWLKYKSEPIELVADAIRLAGEKPKLFRKLAPRSYKIIRQIAFEYNLNRLKLPKISLKQEFKGVADFFNDKKLPSVMNIPKERQLALERFKELNRYKRSVETPSQAVIRLEKEIKEAVRGARSAGDQRQQLLLKQKTKTVSPKTLRKVKIRVENRKQQLKTALVKAKIIGKPRLISLVRIEIQSLNKLLGRQGIKQSLISKTIVIQKARQAVRQAQATVQKLKQAQTQRQAQKVLSAQAQAVAQAVKQAQKVKQAQAVASKVAQLSKLTSSLKKRLKTIKKIVIPPPEFKKQKGKKRKEKKYGKVTRQSFKYTPDIASIIYGKRVTSSSQAKALLRRGRVFSGLETRYITSVPRKSKAFVTKTFLRKFKAMLKRIRKLKRNARQNKINKLKKAVERKQKSLIRLAKNKKSRPVARKQLKITLSMIRALNNISRA